MESLLLPLPPSVNSAYWYNHKTHSMFYGAKAKSWFEEVKVLIHQWKVKHPMFKPYNELFYCDVYFILPRKNSDSHNYFKVLADGFQKFGLVEDDKYIMFRTLGVQYDSKNPRVIVKFNTILTPTIHSDAFIY